MDNNFSVDFVQIELVAPGTNTYTFTSMDIDPAIEYGTSDITWRYARGSRASAVMVVANHQPGAPLRAGYIWESVPLGR